MTYVERMKNRHKCALERLYEAQSSVRGTAGGESADYWRGLLIGLELAMDGLGIEHEAYDPLHWTKE